MHHRSHGRSSLAAIAIVGLLGLGWAGCASRTDLPTSPVSGQSLSERVASPFERIEDAPPADNVACKAIVPFDARSFSHPRTIDNRFSPLAPGLQYVLEGRANRGTGTLPHRVVFTATDVIKEINGVECVVLWDRDFNEGILAEAELAFFAQDDDGNIWTMGEYPEEYDTQSGEFLGAPSTWIGGIVDAEPGLLMLGDPEHGTGYYLQARVPSIRFLDCAKVYKVGQKACVPVGCFDQVLITDETSVLDQRAGHQRKFYAPGVGNIQIGAVGGTEQEVLVMVERRQLSAAELADARREVLRLDTRGYQFNDVYALTKPAR